MDQIRNHYDFLDRRKADSTTAQVCPYRAHRVARLQCGWSMRVLLSMRTIV
jgi:hypothetical protein